MFRKILTSLLAICFFSSQALAAKTSGLIFKDLAMNVVAKDTMEIVYKNQTSIIRKIDAQHFKLNNQDVILSPNDTLEKVQMKIEKAYTASNKRSALLDELFIPKSHANVTPLFAALFGGIVGLGLGSAICNNQSGDGGGESPQRPPPAGATYLAPEGIER